MIVTGRDSGVTCARLPGGARAALSRGEEGAVSLAEGSGLNGLPSAFDVCLTTGR